MVSLVENSCLPGQNVLQVFCVQIAQIPITGNSKKQASPDAFLTAGMVAFLQEFIGSANEDVPSENVRAELDCICRKACVVFFETCAHDL